MGPLSGVLTALITPFKKDGEVYVEALEGLLDFQAKHGVNGVFLCGTAGSGVLMRPDQRKQVFEAAVKYNRGRIKLLAHVGATSTEEAVMLSRDAEEAGVDAIGAIPPYFMKPDESSLMDHFKAIASAVKLPVYIYNIPRQALNTVTPEMMLELSKIPNIVGVKDSSRDFINVLNYLRVLPEDFSVICGTDSYIYPAVAMGAAGCITGYANAFPDIYARFWKAMKEDHEEAKRMQFFINELRGNLQKPPLASHYEALRLRGVESGVPRAPIRGMTDAEREDLKKRLDALGVL
jgi:4-hydroxy-tetrahydrodipicolinate synthase